MKRKIQKALLLCAAFSLLLAAAATGWSRSTAASSGTTSRQETGYTLRDVGGEICIFQNEEQKPCVYTGLRTECLTNEDKKQLEIGIHAASYSEILGLLEDFGS